MENLDTIKNQIAHEFRYSDWGQMERVDPESCLESINEIAIRYANKKIEKAAEIADLFGDGKWIDLHKKNILSLKDKL